MTDPVIRNDIPIPPPHVGRRRAYPELLELQVGDSVFYPGMRTARIGSVWSRAPYKDAGFTFTARKVEEDGIPGVRVWRVE